MVLCVVAICSPILHAQTESSHRIVHTTEKSAIHVPPQEAPTGLQVIYSDLSSSKTDLYLDDRGWLVSGPDSGQQPESIAMRFTPKSNSHVLQVAVALQYGGGANQMNLSIYGDTGGAPGTLLAGPVTVKDLPGAGTCCTLAVADFSAVAVAGGTRYWVVADTPLTGTGSDSFATWDFVVGFIPVGSKCCGSGWEVIDGDLRPAGEVLGTIP
jgi:hypothetical protein